MGEGYIAQANSLLKDWGKIPTGYLPDRVVISVEFHTMPGYRLFEEFKGDQPLWWSLLDLLLQYGVANELALFTLHRPLGPCLNGGRFFSQIVTIEIIGHIQPQEVPCAEAYRFQTIGRPSGDELLPDFQSFVSRHIQFIAGLARVTGSGDQ